MPLRLIAESVLRVEHKLDALLRHLNIPVQPMHFIGLACPACLMPVDYTVDFRAGIVVRRCGCKTGKVPATLPLLPTSPENPNAAADRSRNQEPERDDAPPKRSRRQDR